MRNCYNSEEQRKGKRGADDAEHEKTVAVGKEECRKTEVGGLVT